MSDPIKNTVQGWSMAKKGGRKFHASVKWDGKFVAMCNSDMELVGPGTTRRQVAFGKVCRRCAGWMDH